MQMPIQNKSVFKQRGWCASISTTAVGVIAAGWLTVAAGQDMPNGTLAAAIRGSGHPCDRVLEKELTSASVWRVRCNSGRFQVTMNADSTPEVVPLD